MAGTGLRLFVSYSRRDMVAADELTGALEAQGFEVTIDRRDLPYGEEWQKELGELIRGSDSVVWLVSPDSVASKWCNWELGEVGRLSKRLVPVRIRDLADEGLPESLGKVHVLPATGVYDPKVHLFPLVEALNTDFAWTKQATRLADRAREWIAGDRNASQLLRGPALRHAESWSTIQPKASPAPAGEVLELILASRQAAVRRQQWVIGGSLALAAVAFTLAGAAYVQWREAETQRDAALTSQSRFMAQRSRDVLGEGDFGTALALAVEALPSIESNRPFVSDAKQALHAVMRHRPKELVTFRRHDNSVTGVVFSADGKRVLSASEDGTARLWEAESGKELAVLRGHVGPVNTAVFTGDETRVLTAGADGTARLWDAATGKEVAVLRGHELAVSSAIYSPGRVLTAMEDGTNVYAPGSGRLLTVSRDGTARLWDEAGEKLAVLSHEGRVHTAVLSPDGGEILTASEDGTVRLWAAASGQKLRELRREVGGALSAVFSRDGTRALTTWSNGNVELWPPPERSRPSGDRVMVLRSPFSIVPPGTLSFRGHSMRVVSAVFSPDGKKVLTASDDGTARLWDAATGKEWTEPLKHGLAVSSAVFSPDGTRVLTASQDWTARLWDATSGKLLAMLRGHSAGVNTAVFARNQARIVTGGTDGTARIWEAMSLEEPDRRYAEYDTQKLIDSACKLMTRPLSPKQRSDFFLEKSLQQWPCGWRPDVREKPEYLPKSPG